MYLSDPISSPSDLSQPHAIPQPRGSRQINILTRSFWHLSAKPFARRNSGSRTKPFAPKIVHRICRSCIAYYPTIPHLVSSTANSLVRWQTWITPGGTGCQGHYQMMRRIDWTSSPIPFTTLRGMCFSLFPRLRTHLSSLRTTILIQAYQILR